MYITVSIILHNDTSHFKKKTSAPKSCATNWFSCKLFRPFLSLGLPRQQNLDSKKNRHLFDEKSSCKIKKKLFPTMPRSALQKYSFCFLYIIELNWIGLVTNLTSIVFDDQIQF
jgi:hypothetical protein